MIVYTSLLWQPLPQALTPTSPHRIWIHSLLFTFTHSLTLYSLANSFLFLDNTLVFNPGLLHVTLFDLPSHPRGRKCAIYRPLIVCLL